MLRAMHDLLSASGDPTLQINLPFNNRVLGFAQHDVVQESGTFSPALYSTMSGENSAKARSSAPRVFSRYSSSPMPAKQLSHRFALSQKTLMIPAALHAGKHAAQRLGRAWRVSRQACLVLRTTGNADVDVYGSLGPCVSRPQVLHEITTLA